MFNLIPFAFCHIISPPFYSDHLFIFFNIFKAFPIFNFIVVFSNFILLSPNSLYPLKILTLNYFSIFLFNQ
nr:MAG TPA: hypothetical protein [Caudoviricetes sp.]